MSTYRELYAEGRRRLRMTGIDNADGDARELLLYASGMSLNELLLEYDETPERACARKALAADDYMHMIELRCGHMPLQYITHVQNFCGLDMYVDEHVLIPRQDTEVLVERVLDIYGRRETTGHDYTSRGTGAGRDGSGLSLLDICTGSGCIAVALARLGRFDRIYASDISADALAVARRNAAAHEADITFVKSDMFDAIAAGHIGYMAAGKSETIPERFDVIVSNPPYIPAAQIDMLDEEVRCHEPRLALEGREDGLYYYRRIAGEAGIYLSDGGRVLLEIGCDQGDAVCKLLKAVSGCKKASNGHSRLPDETYKTDLPEGAGERDDGIIAEEGRGYFDNIEITRDLAGLDRVVSAVWRRTDA